MFGRFRRSKVARDDESVGGGSVSRQRRKSAMKTAVTTTETEALMGNNDNAANISRPSSPTLAGESSIGNVMTSPAPSRFGRSSKDSKAADITFNPRLITSQIIALQCFHYAILGFLFQCNHVIFSTSITLDRIFTSKYIKFWSWEGWVDNSAILLSSFVGSVLLALIVEKSKKCLDFSVTLFIIHLIACVCYGGLPDTWDWWIIHIIGTVIMIVFGEYFCSRRELSDIPILGL